MAEMSEREKEIRKRPRFYPPEWEDVTFLLAEINRLRANEETRRRLASLPHDVGDENG